MSLNEPFFLMSINSIVNSRKLCFRPTSQPTHGEKTVSLTRVPGAPHNYSRPLRPRTAPGPYATKPSTLSSSSQQAPSSKSSIMSVVAASESTQQTGTENSTPPLDEKDSAKDGAPPKRGAVSSGKPTSASKPQSRKSASAESEFNWNHFNFNLKTIYFDRNIHGEILSIKII